MDWSGKKVVVAGAGESGLKSALFLKRKGIEVFLTELKEAGLFLNAKWELDSVRVPNEFGSHTWGIIERADLAILSPGISPKAEIYRRLVAAGIPIWSEIELAYHFCPGRIIGVTGSNGKTTVTTLIHRCLQQAGMNAVKCGNIGNAFINEVERMNSDSVAVVELSSFQLMHTQSFRPFIGILLNLTPNHFDWHADMEEYRRAKWKMFANQMKQDFAIINVADEEDVKRSLSLKSQVVYFDGTFSKRPNFSVVEQVANLMGVDLRLTRQVLQDFKGLEHRMEEVETCLGVHFINDSKSTSIASLQWALTQLGGEVVLIAGGKYKGGDFKTLRALVREKVKFIAAIGESKKMIQEAFEDMVPVHLAESLEEAFRVARSVSRAGQSVLFSPACSSFDMFRNYEERGCAFKTLVKAWHDECSSVQTVQTEVQG